MCPKWYRGRGPRAVAAAGGRKVEKLTICKEGAWFSGNQAAHPGVPGRGAEGVRELLWAPRGAAGRLPDSSAPLWAPFFQLSWDRRARGSDFRTKFGPRGVVFRQKLPSSRSPSGFNYLV